MNVIGIDEAGRGPLAGPLAVGAFSVKSASLLRLFRGVKDSKQLTPEDRETWYKKILLLKKNRVGIDFAVTFVSEGTIDSIGLTKAVAIGVKRSLDKLQDRKMCFSDSTILLDGLLHAPKIYTKQRTIIGGDESEKIIALASICAKVLRDRKMIRLSDKYPKYRFDVHKGYGTKEHYNILRSLGPSAIHRQSFLKKFHNT